MIDKLQISGLLRALAPASGHLPEKVAGAAAEEDFASVLAGFAQQTVETMRVGEQAAIDGLEGRASLQEVVDKVMAAEHALQSAMAVREKVVAAYLEISRMTI